MKNRLNPSRTYNVSINRNKIKARFSWSKKTITDSNEAVTSIAKGALTPNYHHTDSSFANRYPHDTYCSWYIGTGLPPIL